LAEIETVSRVTGRIFRACEGSGSPRRERRAPYKAGGRTQNFVHLVTGHTPGQIERNGTGFELKEDYKTPRDVTVGKKAMVAFDSSNVEKNESLKGTRNERHDPFSSSAPNSSHK